MLNSNVAVRNLVSWKQFVFLGGMRIMDDFASLTQLSDDERENATQKYQIIEPYINNVQPLKMVAKNKSIPIRTLGLWVKKYRAHGLVGLARQSRCDKGLPREYGSSLQKTIEGLYLKKPMLSGANIHKLITEYCHQNNLKAPSYRSVCRIIFNIPDDMVLLGQQGSKAYKQQYDLLHIRAAERPNELWQADHVLLDFDVLNDKNKQKWTPKMRQWCRIETIVVGVKKWLRKSSVQSLKQKLQSKH